MIEHVGPSLGTFEASARALMDAAFEGDFSDADWQHALGGVHAWLVDGDEVVAHASVVSRILWVGSVRVEAGYVEAVAVLPDRQGQGLGSRVMRLLPCADYPLCALSTGEHRFYRGLGWQSWRGPTYVRTHDATVRTEDEDDGIMVLKPHAFDITASLTCEDRPGDAW